MKDFQPHVYLAAYNGEFILSVLTKVPADKILNKSPELIQDGQILQVSFSIDSRAGNGPDWISGKTLNTINFKKLCKKVERIRVTIDSKNPIDLLLEEDFQSHEEYPVELASRFPHLFSERDGDEVLMTVCQKSKSKLALTIDDATVVSESSPSGIVKRDYQVYSEERKDSGSRVSAESDEYFKKKNPKKKKSKVRHSY